MNAPAVFPTTPAQQRIMLVEQLFPGGSAYHVPFAVRLRGSLDVGVLTRAVREVVARHESLRTVFTSVDGVLGQVVEDDPHVPVEVRDVAGSPASDDEEALISLVGDVAAEPFDLTGRLLRVVLLRLADDEHVLSVTMHHLISDMWSCGVFVGELTSAYPALRAGQDLEPPPLPVQYVDYTVWQRDQLEGDRARELLDYWRERLSGMPPALELPGDRPRPPVQSLRGATAVVRLSAETSDAVKRTARTLGVTAFSTLLSAFQATLGRWTGGEDITVSSGVANRTPQVESLIGCFINVLLFRTSLADDPSFAELTTRVSRTVLDGVEHQDLPFDRLVEELAPHRDLSHQPLAQVMFLVQNAPLPHATAGELRLSSVPVRRRSTHLDLNVQLWDAGSHFEGVIDYSTDLFDEATVHRMWAQYETLLTAAVARPDEPVSHLPLLSAEDERALVHPGNPTEADPSPALTPRRVEEQAARTPDDLAVVADDGGLTYRELNVRANRLARLLIAEGAEPEGTVALMLPRGVDVVVAVLAVLKSGAAYVPIDPELPADRVAYMLDDAAPSVVVTVGGIPTDLTGPVRRVELDAPETHQALAGHGAEDPTDAERRAPLRPENLAYVIYTSGSTGRPKGVLISHRALADYLATCARDYPGLAGASLLHSPSSVDLSVTTLLGPLVVGGHLLLGQLDGRVDTLPAGRRSPLSFLKITPSHLPIVRGLPPRYSPTVDLVIGGEALLTEVLDRWRASSPTATVTNEYGPTEATVGCVAHRVEPGAPLRSGAVPIGRPMGNTRAYVLDSRLRPVPVGIPGELYVAGVGLARGYHGRPALTAEKFPPDPYGPPGSRMYRTGDLARWNGDGVLGYLGRVDDQVKVRGFRIELGEIEAALVTCPGVAEATVHTTTVSGDTTLAAYYVPTTTAAPSPAELRAHLRGTLPDYMVPTYFTALDEIPLAVSGKADRSALPPVSTARPSPAARFVAARTPVEALLCDVWGSVLNLERVGVHDEFFELGGYSLAATRIAALVNELFGVEIPLRAVFETVTVAEQAALVVEAGEAQRVDVAAVARIAQEIGELSEEEVETMLAG
ncbi:amino acid adenylation domain-containing protein [Streptomyces sp. NPDC005438]|uniref:non-ribosomal peptide synthetase n=1 Tax=Streptomyces sp. NPDC005438 TaxID=3156880 RepID=UPI0033A08BAC